MEKSSFFLKNLKRKLELRNIEVYQSKAEEVREKFDIVISRALWSIKEFVQRCKHLLKDGGFF